jgi:hypothetical protein
MAMKMDPIQEAAAKLLFGTPDTYRVGKRETKPDDREGKTRLTVRFDPSTLTLSAPTGRRTKLPGATLLHYVEEPAQTPTGGRYTRRALTVRTSDGRKWFGTMKNGTDIVKLRLAPNGE